MTAARKPRGVDPASYVLAEHFLTGQMPGWWDEARRADFTMSLAEDIQEAVEDWFFSKEMETRE